MTLERTRPILGGYKSPQEWQAYDTSRSTVTEIKPVFPAIKEEDPLYFGALLLCKASADIRRQLNINLSAEDQIEVLQLTGGKVPDLDSEYFTKAGRKVNHPQQIINAFAGSSTADRLTFLETNSSLGVVFKHLIHLDSEELDYWLHLSHLDYVRRTP